MLGYVLPGFIYLKTYKNDFVDYYNNTKLLFLKFCNNYNYSNTRNNSNNNNVIISIPIIMIIFGLSSLLIGITTIIINYS